MSENPTETTTADDSTERNGNAFWADSVADRVRNRFERIDGEEPIVVRGAVSPSGVPHLGHANEILRGHFVAEALRAPREGDENAYEVEQVFTADDRDPLRKVPRTLADLDWNLMDLGETEDPGALGRNLGKPLTTVPDPFGCCESFGAHQTRLLESMVESLGVPVEIRSTTEMYESGAFDATIRELLEKREAARELLGEYQASVRENDDYVPFMALCEECGTYTTTITATDPKAGEVEYVCTDFEAGNRAIEGCGHRGVAGLRDGKLPWRFEWPAQWRVLKTDFEPFGKDHAEGSWPSGEAIARDLLDFEPPTPMTYEWFTLDGEALSSSSGHVVTVQEMLSMLELEVLRYFFTKDPTTARNLAVAELDQLTNEFDGFERIAFGASTIDDTDDTDDTDDEERRRTDRAYSLLVEERPEKRPVRLPYSFAAVLGMTDDDDLRERMARREGHFPANASEGAIENALSRVDRARRWAERTDNAYNYRLANDLPDVEFTEDTKGALDDLAEFVEDGHAGEAIQSAIFETAREHGLEPGTLFSAGYRLFFDTDQGPKLGPFLAELDREFVTVRLRREG